MGGVGPQQVCPRTLCTVYTSQIGQQILLYLKHLLLPSLRLCLDLVMSIRWTVELSHVLQTQRQ